MLTQQMFQNRPFHTTKTINLTELKYKLDAQLKVLEMIVVDDCCSVRPSYQKIFIDVPVRLDIIYAWQ